MSTPTEIADNTAALKDVIVALNEVRDELKECLKTAGGGPAAPAVSGGASVVASVPSSTSVTGGVAGGGSISSSALPPPSSTINLNLLLKVANADATGIEECRIVNTAPKDLPASRKGEFWFTHQVELTSNSSSGIGLSVGGTIAIGAVTFLKETGSADPDAQNTKEITIQQQLIDNIIALLETAPATGPTYKIPDIYLKDDSSSWSYVDEKPTDPEETKKTLKIEPDIFVSIDATPPPFFYVLSFVDEIDFVDDNLKITFIDNSTPLTHDKNTITNVNNVLNTLNDKVNLLGGGKKKRQSRKSQKYTKKTSKGGKRYRRKSRRFR